MGAPHNGLNGRAVTIPVRVVEAKPVKRIVKDRFGKGHTGKKFWVFCSVMNNYR